LSLPTEKYRNDSKNLKINHKNYDRKNKICNIEPIKPPESFHSQQSFVTENDTSGQINNTRETLSESIEKLVIVDIKRKTDVI